jgi:hypothetical protein
VGTSSPTRGQRPLDPLSVAVFLGNDIRDFEAFDKDFSKSSMELPQSLHNLAAYSTIPTPYAIVPRAAICPRRFHQEYLQDKQAKSI